jgi:riboflavin kinase/FMN adenylyltransferase
MKVYEGLDNFHPLKNAIVTTGTFDGVHIGHQKIINRLVEMEHIHGGESLVITFWPHPRRVIAGQESKLQLISTLDEKIVALEKYHIRHLLIIEFNEAFSQMSSTAFIEEILVKKVGTKVLVIGYDHRFGRNREGSFEYLQANAHQYGFAVEEIPRQDVEAVGVSSTRIRQALIQADIETANAYLGRPFSLRAKVVKGNQIGRTLGFPTANLHVEEPYKIIPANGTYAVKVKVRGRVFKGMLNIGFRPTLPGEKNRTIEANLFEFTDDIYDESVEVLFFGLIRQEIKFADLDQLAEQLVLDRTKALEVLSAY